MGVGYRVEKAPDNSDHGVGLLFVEFERRECLVKGDDFVFVLRQGLMIL